MCACFYINNTFIEYHIYWSTAVVDKIEEKQLGRGELRILEGKRNFSRLLAVGDNKVRTEIIIRSVVVVNQF